MVLAAARRDSLTATEIKGVVELVRQASPEQEAFILAKPREALQLAEGVPGPGRNPRLTALRPDLAGGGVPAGGAATVDRRFQAAHGGGAGAAADTERTHPGAR